MPGLPAAPNRQTQEPAPDEDHGAEFGNDVYGYCAIHRVHSDFLSERVADEEIAQRERARVSLEPEAVGSAGRMRAAPVRPARSDSRFVSAVS